MAVCAPRQEQLGFLEAERYNGSLVGMLMLANMLGVSLNYTMYAHQPSEVVQIVLWSLSHFTLQRPQIWGPCDLS